MAGAHGLTVEEALWLARLVEGRLKKEPREFGIPDHVCDSLLARQLIHHQLGFIEITAEGLAEVTRQRSGAAQDTFVDRAPVLVLISPATPGEPPLQQELRDRQARMTADMLRIAIDAALVDHAAAHLGAERRDEAPPVTDSAADEDREPTNPV